MTLSDARDRSESSILSFRGATMGFGDRLLWRGLDLDVGPRELIAVLGANGAGKSTLFRAILGEVALDGGSISFLGEPVRHGDRRIGYIPQQHLFPRGTPLRGRDLVGFGVDGYRFGSPFHGRNARRRVSELVTRVGADAFAGRPVGDLSGGEQQRLRVAQALAGDPRLLLCDEPFASLDVRNQEQITSLIDGYRQESGAPVLFITHDINPVLPVVTRVLYLAGGRFRIGTVNEVLQAEVLSELFGTPIQVVRTNGRIFVVGVPDTHHDTAFRRASSTGGVRA